MLSTFEEFLLYVTIPLVALFAHKEYTYEFSTPKYAILCVATLILAVYLLIRLFKSKQLRFFATPVHFAWLTFAFVAIASTINTYRDNPYFFRQSIDIALYLLLNVVLSFYFSSRLNDKSKIIKLLFVFLLTGLFIAINAILNFYVGYDLFLGNVGAPFEREHKSEYRQCYIRFQLFEHAPTNRVVFPPKLGCWGTEYKEIR